MKSLKIILLAIGILGIASGVYSLISDGDTMNTITGLVCGSGLILGAFNLEKHNSDQKD